MQLSIMRSRQHMGQAMQHQLSHSNVERIGEKHGLLLWISMWDRTSVLQRSRPWMIFCITESEKARAIFSLEKFIAQHHNAFVLMQQWAEHVTFQLPNKFTWMTYLLDAVQCGDARLQAAMALVWSDDQPGGKMHDFEGMASYLLPYDPVAKKHAAQ